MKVSFILGMHRSGTTCLAKCLDGMGLSFILDQLGPMSYAKHLEYPEVVQLNDEILGDWRNPNIKVNFLKKKILNYKVKKFLFNAHKGNNWIGLKDPRFVFTIDFWLPHISEFKMIGIFRRPGEVARSLEARKSGYGYATYKQGLKLWFLSNKNLLRLQNKYKFPILNFNASKAEFAKALERACNLLDLPFSLEVFNNTFIETKRHHEEKDIPQELESTYNSLLSIYNQLL